MVDIHTRDVFGASFEHFCDSQSAHVLGGDFNVNYLYKENREICF